MGRSTFGYIKKHGKYGKYRVYWSENRQRRSKVVDNMDEATKLLAKKRLQEGHVDSTVTFNSYYKSVIEPSYKNLAKRTIYDYDYAWKKIKPYIGKRKIAETNWHIIQEVIDKFDNPKMQQKAYVLLRKILNFAVCDDIIVKNPCNKNVQRKKVEKKIKKLYTSKELCKVLAQVNGTEFALPVLLECCCGLRHEEYCALGRKDCTHDQDDDFVFFTIDKALTEVYGKKVLKTAKNNMSVRLVVLHPKFVPYFYDNIKYLKKKEKMDDYPYPLRLTKKWKRFCNNNNISHIPFGSMRSVYATLCSEAGCVDSIVGMTMGHSGNTIKEKNYQNATKQALKINSEIFANYIHFNYKSKNDINK